MTDKTREEFEAWARSSLTFSEMFLNWSDTERDYIGAVARAMFLGWRASRAELVIDLPQAVGFEGGYDSHRDNEFSHHPDELMDADDVFALCRLIEVREAIEAAGVKVKA